MIDLMCSLSLSLSLSLLSSKDTYNTYIHTYIHTHIQYNTIHIASTQKKRMIDFNFVLCVCVCVCMCVCVCEREREIFEWSPPPDFNERQCSHRTSRKGVAIAIARITCTQHPPTYQPQLKRGWERERERERERESQSCTLQMSYCMHLFLVVVARSLVA